MSRPIKRKTMREIKFRGRRTLNGEWVYGNLMIKQADSPVPETSEPYKCYYIVAIDGLYYYEHEVDPSTIGQYTGLKDKNGTEIYEGDILSENGNIIGVVVWSARYGVSIRKKNTTWALINFCLDSDFGCGTLSNIKVIGNIHDNPELLKGGGKQ